jgi:hypothetical protein
MADLSSKICGIAGVLGALLIDHNGVVIEKSYLSEPAQAILEGLKPSLLQMLQHCERHNPDLQHLRLRFRELTVFVKRHERGSIIALCQNDLIIYLLESAIESLLAAVEKPESA